MAEAARGVIIVGATSTAARLTEELVRAGQPVTCLVPRGSWLVDEIAERGADVRRVDAVREADLRAAGVERARAVVLLGDDDVVAMRLALLVEELAPSATLVMEMANPGLGGRLGQLLGNCVALSSAELAAPSFVAAALAGGHVESFEIAGRRVVAGRRDRVGGEQLAVLGDSAGSGIDQVLSGEGDVVLGTEVVGGDAHVQRSGMLGALAGVFDHRVRVVLLVLLGLMLVSTLYFHYAFNITWLMAVYVALTASTLTGIGDIGDLPIGARFAGVVIQLFGVILSSGITAVIVDALISSRLASLSGGVRGKPRNHIVVCGLGRVGREVAMRLRERKAAVVAIERDADSPGVLAARRAGIPVIIAEATDPTALEQAGLDRASALLAVTDNDAVNLETAMVAKERNASVRIVTRLFDHDLADRVERRLELGPTRSVSMLAAPTFAAAALGRRREQVISVGRRVLIFTELVVQEGSAAERGLSTEALLAHNRALLLALQRPGEAWEWSPKPTTLRPGDRIAVAATRIGLAGILRLIKRPTSEAARVITPRDGAEAVSPAPS